MLWNNVHSFHYLLYNGQKNVSFNGGCIVVGIVMIEPSASTLKFKVFQKVELLDVCSERLIYRHIRISLNNKKYVESWLNRSSNAIGILPEYYKFSQGLIKNVTFYLSKPRYRGLLVNKEQWQ